MRGMRMMQGSVVGLVVGLAMLTSAASASATPAYLPAGTAFAATSTGEHVFGISSNIKWRCNHVTWTGTTADPAGDTASIAGAYGSATGAPGSWCRFYMGGTFVNSTVTTSGWSTSVSSFNALTGVSNGAITMGGGMTVQTGACTVTIASGTVVPLQGQNIGSPAGMTVTVNATGIHYTSTSPACSLLGVPASGTTMFYSGTSDVPGVYVG